MSRWLDMTWSEFIEALTRLDNTQFAILMIGIVGAVILAAANRAENDPKEPW